MPHSKVAVQIVHAPVQHPRMGWSHTPLTVPHMKRQHTVATIALKVSAQASIEQQTKTQTDIQGRLDKAVGLINTADLLAPFDRASYTAALVIWCVGCREQLLTHSSSLAYLYVRKT